MPTTTVDREIRRDLEALDRIVAIGDARALVWEGLFPARSEVWRRCRALYAPVAAEIRGALDGDAPPAPPGNSP